MKCIHCLKDLLDCSRKPCGIAIQILEIAVAGSTFLPFINQSVWFKIVTLIFGLKCFLVSSALNAHLKVMAIFSDVGLLLFSCIITGKIVLFMCDARHFFVSKTENNSLRQISQTRLLPQNFPLMQPSLFAFQSSKMTHIAFFFTTLQGFGSSSNRLSSSFLHEFTFFHVLVTSVRVLTF